jgi:hypothetical protein
MFCHAGLSSIFLQEGFQTSWNDNQYGLTYGLISKYLASPKAWIIIFFKKE